MNRWIRSDQRHREWWECQGCPTWQDIVMRDDSAAAAHVRDTEHTVAIFRLEQHDIVAVLEDQAPDWSPPAPDRMASTGRVTPVPAEGDQHA